MQRTYDLDFARSVMHLTDGDIEFGLRYGFLEPSSHRLDHLFPKDELPRKWSHVHDKWRLVALKWAIMNCNTTRALFDEVDTIWAEFNEPSDMNHLVSFMPTGDPFASEHSLLEDIHQFVKSKAEELGGL